MKYTDIYNDADLAQYNQQFGYHFFDEDTLRFFDSRILDIKRKETGTGELKIVFITSEQCNWGDNPRQYSLREILENGSVINHVKFHSSLRRVKKLIRLPYDQMLVEAAKLKSN